jgi:Raf kinase inhibitor-like YbhB/YbcL family protein
MQIASTAFVNGAAIPERFTCDDANLSPPLDWHDLPAGALSLALVCSDPDAPSGTFYHWAVFDIPADRTGLAEGMARTGEQPIRQAVNDFGKTGYDGPCPPRGHGRHRYGFRLYALSVDRLPLRNPSCRDVEREVRRHLLDEAMFVGSYERSR